MSQTQPTPEIYPIQGELPHEELPLAANQILNPGEPVYLVNGQVTKWIAPSSQGTTSQPFYGWVDEPTWITVSGTQTARPAGTLVSVIPACSNVCWNLPSYGTAPTVAMLGNGNYYTIINDGGVYKIDLSVTSNGVVMPYMLDDTDARSNSGARTWKATPVVGDKMKCFVNKAAKQIPF